MPSPCAFPGCNARIVDAKGKYIAEMCHVEGAKQGSERYNPNQTQEQTAAEANLILMCHEHHVETDDENVYTVEKMREIKMTHEAHVANLGGSSKLSPADLDRIVAQMESVAAAAEATAKVAKSRHRVGNRSIILEMKRDVEERYQEIASLISQRNFSEATRKEMEFKDALNGKHLGIISLKDKNFIDQEIVNALIEWHGFDASGQHREGTEPHKRAASHVASLDKLFHPYLRIHLD